jgi:hypothetical protein
VRSIPTRNPLAAKAATPPSRGVGAAHPFRRLRARDPRTPRRFQRDPDALAAAFRNWTVAGDAPKRCAGYSRPGHLGSSERPSCSVTLASREGGRPRDPGDQAVAGASRAHCRGAARRARTLSDEDQPAIENRSQCATRSFLIPPRPAPPTAPGSDERVPFPQRSAAPDRPVAPSDPQKPSHAWPSASAVRLGGSTI